jgi:hypothetical protein
MRGSAGSSDRLTELLHLSFANLQLGAFLLLSGNRRQKHADGLCRPPPFANEFTDIIRRDPNDKSDIFLVFLNINLDLIGRIDKFAGNTFEKVLHA